MQLKKMSNPPPSPPQVCSGWENDFAASQKAVGIAEKVLPEQKSRARVSVEHNSQCSSGCGRIWPEPLVAKRSIPIWRQAESPGLVCCQVPPEGRYFLFSTVVRGTSSQSITALSRFCDCLYVESEHFSFFLVTWQFYLLYNCSMSLDT